VAAGYSATPLAKKLGIRVGSRIFCVGAPKDFRRGLQPLPASVVFVSHPGTDVDIAHVFTAKRAELAERLARLRATLGPAAAVWVSWPKKSAKVASEISEGTIREVAMPLGFVDIKVCAIDAVWSGLKLVVRKELR